MPGRFREGTETCIRKVRTLETLPTCRQTQNPERGRKLEIQHHIRSCGMLPKSSDPKPREGTETRGTVPPGPAPSGSSDPKPREGTETPRGWRMRCARKCRQTQNPERGRKLEIQHHIRSCGMLPKSSDPKPREGTETLMVGHGRARLSGSSDPKPREGTETGRRIAPGAGGAAVVRPKTPRGDGNTETQHQPDNLILASSDPKPREGTETRRWPVNRRG
ncbi:Uncharacterised protein [Mycobacterium tuberculosis]|nr:Uncharacterised protein [Mycobacterium tuberculosis]